LSFSANIDTPVDIAPGAIVEGPGSVTGIVQPISVGGTTTEGLKGLATGVLQVLLRDPSPLAVFPTGSTGVPANVYIFGGVIGDPTTTNITATAPASSAQVQGSSFTQVAQQEKVSRTNYAAPYFCKRNCPVVSAAADQLSIGAAFNGFEVDGNGVATAGGTQQTLEFLAINAVSNPNGAEATVLLNSTVVAQYGGGTGAAGKVVSVSPVVLTGPTACVV